MKKFSPLTLPSFTKKREGDGPLLKEALAVYSTPEARFATITETNMPPQSKEELAAQLQQKGERYLLSGDLTGIRFFEMSSSLEPENFSFLHSQALALFEYGCSNHSPKELRHSIKKFKAVGKILPTSFENNYAWANALCTLAEKTGSKSLYISAKSKYKKAAAHSENQPNDVLAELHWEYAKTWIEIAKDSGEAIDLHMAIRLFEQANSLHDDHPTEFWQHYGNAVLALAKQTNDIGLFIKSIDCYKNAISLSISSYEGWLSLANALAELYSYTQDEDHFSQANECFATAVKFQSTDPGIWTRWARLLKDSGALLKDEKKLHSAIDKCKRASLCFPEGEEVTYIWTEALALIGTLSDSLSHLHEAQNKISSIDESIQTPDRYHTEGIVLHSLGEYYADLDLYYQAIEKFQLSLSANRSQPKVWFALGQSYLHCFEIEQDVKLLELSAKFFGKALNLQLSSRYHFCFALTEYKLADIHRDEEMLETSLSHFEQALALQKNAIYLHPEWLFHYACTLDLMGDFTDTDTYYSKALEILGHVLMVDPDYQGIHYQIALVYAHFADLVSDTEMTYRSLHHFRIAHLKDPENDQIILDWGITILSLALLAPIPDEALTFFQEAEYKLIRSAKLGNTQAYYFLACHAALTGNHDGAMRFLLKSFASGSLPPLQEVMEDEWLDSISETAMFKEFVYQIEKSSQARETD